MTELEAAFDAAAAELRAADRIVVSGHVRPDGDALGSMLAIALAAREAGKEAFATFSEPFHVPTAYGFLDLSCLVSPDTDFGEIDLFIACDTASPDRLGSVASVARSAKRVLIIDHHLSNSGFGDVAVVDPGAAATAQLVHTLLTKLGWKVSEPVAVALYPGLVTDTGRFQYSRTSPAVHRIAAELL